MSLYLSIEHRERCEHHAEDDEYCEDAPEYLKGLAVLWVENHMMDYGYGLTGVILAQHERIPRPQEVPTLFPFPLRHRGSSRRSRPRRPGGLGYLREIPEERGAFAENERESR